jgi:uncharacterized protein YecE (DUF72 family)
MMAGENKSSQADDAYAWWAPASVVHGTCGWTDESLAKSGFFPPTARSSLERLSFYATKFPSVEVDMSTYAIPTADMASRWAAAVPPGFIFHVKCFGLFCGVAVQLGALPRSVREMPCMAPCIAARGSNSSRIGVDELPTAALEALWALFHDALRPLRDARKLGAVVVQYQNSFAPSAPNRELVEECRRRLGGSVHVALEFRNRCWFADARLEETLRWIRRLGCTSLIAADDLKHETLQPDRAQKGPGEGMPVERLPIALHVTDERMVYVRVHRRHGVHRLLSSSELREWVERLRPSSLLRQGCRGPVFFLWGTAHSDQPVAVGEAESARGVLPKDGEGAGATPLENGISAWQRRQREAAPPKSSLLSMWSKQSVAAATPALAPTPAPAAAAATTSPADASLCEPFPHTFTGPSVGTSGGSSGSVVKKRKAVDAPRGEAGQRQLSAFWSK